MNILVAIDSFKGSVSSLEANNAVAEGLQLSMPDADVIMAPLADGGEGTVDAFLYHDGEKISCSVTGPLGEKVETYYAKIHDDTAVIEAANICGLPMVSKSQQNPMHTTSFGMGEVILHAISHGCKKIIVGLGGSCTNDAGIGMLQALGMELLNANHQAVPYGAQGLLELTSIHVEKLNKALQNITFIVASDVTNPLCGEMGATAIFGPQKGLDIEMIPLVDHALAEFAELTKATVNKEICELTGAGAAGGLGAAFLGYLNAELVSGIDLIADYLHLKEKIEASDLVITGEGRLDRQTVMGKGPIGIAKLCQQQYTPVIGIAGSIDNECRELLVKNGFTSCFSIIPGPMSLQEAMDSSTALSNLRNTSFYLGSLINSFKN